MMTRSTNDTERGLIISRAQAVRQLFHQRLDKVLESTLKGQIACLDAAFTGTTAPPYNPNPFLALSSTLFGPPETLAATIDENIEKIKSANQLQPITLSEPPKPSLVAFGCTSQTLPSADDYQNLRMAKGANKFRRVNSLIGVDLTNKGKLENAPPSTGARHSLRTAQVPFRYRQAANHSSESTSSSPSSSRSNSPEPGNLIIDESLAAGKPTKKSSHTKLISAGRKRTRPVSSASTSSTSDSGLDFSLPILDIKHEFEQLLQQQQQGSADPKPPKANRRRSSTIYVQDESMNNFSQDNRKDNMITLNIECLNDGCSLIFVEKTDMIKHMEVEHNVQQYRCQVENCGVSFKTQQNLTTHLTSIHGDVKDFVCCKCTRSYRSYQFLAHHYYTDHAVGLFQCAYPDCATYGRHRFEISRHFEQEHRTYKCSFPDCTQIFNYTGHLRVHERSVHLDCKAYSCAWPECTYATGNASHLTAHIRTRHFGLPSTAKKQARLNIVDHRDPKDFVRVDKEKLQWATEVIAQVRKGTLKLEDETEE